MLNSEIAINISPELAQRIKRRIEGTEFTSVSSYVDYILNQVLLNIETNQEEEKKELLSEGQQKKVEERLKRLDSLGYLD